MSINKREINELDAYFRLANYLSVGQLYLLDNPPEFCSLFSKKTSF